MTLEETLAILEKHHVASAYFRQGGELESVLFHPEYPTAETVIPGDAVETPTSHVPKLGPSMSKAFDVFVRGKIPPPPAKE